MTATNVRPLTTTELNKLVSLYGRMSPAAKEAFIAMVMMKYEDNFLEIITFLGTLYERNIARA